MSQLNTYETNIFKFEKALRELSEKNHRLSTSIVDSEARLSQYISEVTILTKALAEETSKNASLRENCRLLSMRAAQRDVEIDEVMQKLLVAQKVNGDLYDTVANCELEIKQLRSSTSWRITSPIRWIKIMFISFSQKIPRLV